MAGARNSLDGGGGGGGSGAPGTPTKPSGKVPGGSPGLLTSTGGLFGLGGQLLIPYRDLITNRFYIALINPSDFNSEEESTYFFPQEDVQPGRVVNVHKLEIEYRNLGVCSFSCGVIVYVPNKNPQQPGVYKTKSVNFKIGSDKADNLLYTVFANLVISGMRPQAFIHREANAGPMSVTRVMMVGNADEKDLM